MQLPLTQQLRLKNDKVFELNFSYSPQSSAAGPLELLQLPVEVLITIIDSLDFSSLKKVTLVCRQFNYLAEPFLYHTIKLLTGRQAAALCTSLSVNEYRTKWIRSLLVSTKFGDDHGLSLLPPFVAQMRNLRDLRLETPDCNAKVPEDRVDWVNLQDRYERMFETASALISNPAIRHLPNLQSCTMHFVDSNKEIYSMTTDAMLFLHPELKSLTMSCASTDFPQKLLVPFQNDPALVKSTSLEHLHLEECDIWSPTLSILLSFPRALRSLKISEGVRYDGMFSPNSSRMHGNVNPGLFVDAVAEQCEDTLEELSLSLGHFRHGSQDIRLYGNHLDLTRFAKIKSLELDLRTLNLVRVRPVCDHDTARRLPPNLQRLKVFSIPLGQRMPFRALVRPYFPFDICFVESKMRHGIPHLKNLIFSYEFFHQDAESSDVDGERVEEGSQVAVAQDRLLEKCEEFRARYRKANIRLEIEMVILPNGFIPPYLYPEESPRPYLFWESMPAEI